MRLLHTSDWHLGRSLHGHSLLEDQRLVLEQLLLLIQQRQVDVLLLAGDVYDRSLPPESAVALFNEFLERLLVELEVTVVVIPGNHDSALRLGFGAALLKPQGLHLLTDLSAIAQPVQLEVRKQRVNIFGLPFASPELVRSTFGAPAEGVRSSDDAMAFLLQQLTPLPDGVNLLLAHCFVAGGLTSDSERPLSVGGADQVSARHFDPFDYVALGHLHGPNSQGRDCVRYSGSLLKYSVSEAAHVKSVVLFDVSEQGVHSVETVALHGRRQVRIVEGSLETVLREGAADASADDYVQIVLHDPHALHDVHGRLAAVYPNRLQVLRPNVGTRRVNAAQALATMQRGELAMFADFYKHSVGRELLPAERLVVEQGLAALNTQTLESAGSTASQ